MQKNRDLSKISKYQKLSGIIFLIISILVPFAPAITLISSKIAKTYSMGYNFMFGGNIVNNNASYEIKSISILSLIAILFLFVSFILVITSLFMYKKKEITSKWILFIGAILILTSSIMMMCSHQSIANSLADALINSHSDTVSNTVFNNSHLEFGIYGVSIFSLLSSISLFASLIFDGTFDKVRLRLGII